MRNSPEPLHRRISRPTEAESGDIMVKALAVSLVFMLYFPAAFAHEPGQVSTLDVQALPLGDGKVSSEPRVGYVYACTSSFRSGGARHAGDWIPDATSRRKQPWLRVPVLRPAIRAVSRRRAVAIPSTEPASRPPVSWRACRGDVEQKRN